MLEIWIKIIAAYLLGNILGGDVAGHFRGVNLRDQGSGNVGATNAMRSQGAGFALLVLLIDVGKAIVAVAVLPILPWYDGVAAGAGVADTMWSWLPVLCGVAVILGHCYPFRHQFKGGKGVASMVGVVAVLATAQFPWLILLWFVVLVLTGYVSLASMLAAVLLLVLVVIYNFVTMDTQIALVGEDIQEVTTASLEIRFDAVNWPEVMFAVWLAVFIAFSHRSNISRLIRGGESRFDKIMLLHRMLRLGPHRRPGRRTS